MCSNCVCESHTWCPWCQLWCHKEFQRTTKQNDRRAGTIVEKRLGSYCLALFGSALASSTFQAMEWIDVNSALLETRVQHHGVLFNVSMLAMPASWWTRCTSKQLHLVRCSYFFHLCSPEMKWYRMCLHLHDVKLIFRFMFLQWLTSLALCVSGLWASPSGCIWRDPIGTTDTGIIHSRINRHFQMAPLSTEDCQND